VRVRIFFQAFSLKNLKKAILVFKEKLFILNCSISEVVSLPAKKKIFCVLKSPHINKNAREAFELKIYKKLLDISFPNIENFSNFLSLCVPSGIFLKIKLLNL
jgi:small subunit ribosomal protein S10